MSGCWSKLLLKTSLFELFTKYYFSDQTKEVEMDGHIECIGEVRNTYKMYAKILEGNGSL